VGSLRQQRAYHHLEPIAILVSFTAAVHDQANPFQTASANYTISFAALGSGQVVFNTQPGNSIGDR